MRLKYIVYLLPILIFLSFSGHTASIQEIQEIIDKSSINLMWIFKQKPESEFSFIFPEPIIRSLSKRQDGPAETIAVFEKIAQWRALNPKTKINLWYDSSVVHEFAVQNTVNKLKEMSLENVSLIDLNQALKSDSYKVLINHELPIYFRADIARILAGIQVIEDAFSQNNEGQFFAYFDHSVDPIELTKLYEEQDTLEKLSQYGMVMGKTKMTRYENSFFVMGANDYESWIPIKRALDEAIVDKNLRELSHPYPQINEQSIWKDYDTFFAVLGIFQGRSSYCAVTQTENKIKKGGLWTKEIILDRKLSPEELARFNALELVNSSKYMLCKEENAKLVEDATIIPTRDGISKPSKFNN